MCGCARPAIVFTDGQDGIANIIDAQAVLFQLTPNEILGAVAMGGAVYRPGVYQGTAATVAADSVVTFDAENSTQVQFWIINLSSALTVAAGSEFKIINVGSGGAVVI